MHDKTNKTPKLTIALYLAIMFLSGTGQITGALRWLHLPEDFPGWSKPFIIIALVVFLDLSVLVLVRDFVQRRRRGNRATGHMFAIGFTLLLGVAVTFVGHWSDDTFDQIMAIVFASSTLIGSVVVLITTDLTEDETSVRHRNVRRAMVALVKNQPIQADAKRVLIQSINFGLVTDGITEQMDNNEIIRQVMGIIDPKVLTIDNKVLATAESEDVDDFLADDVAEPDTATTPETAEAALPDSGQTSDIVEFLQSGADNISQGLDEMIEAMVKGAPDAPSSVAEIIKESGAAKSTVYRKLNQAKADKARETEGSLTED